MLKQMRKALTQLIKRSLGPFYEISVNYSEKAVKPMKSVNTYARGDFYCAKKMMMQIKEISFLLNMSYTLYPASWVSQVTN